MRTNTAKKVQDARAAALKAKGQAMIKTFAEWFPVGSEIQVVGKGVTVESIGNISATLRGPKGKEYTLTPCLNATVMGKPDAKVYAAVSIAGFRAKGIRFAIVGTQIIELD